jgi:hypothetical protein
MRSVRLVCELRDRRRGDDGTASGSTSHRRTQKGQPAHHRACKRMRGAAGSDRKSPHSNRCCRRTRRHRLDNISYDYELPMHLCKNTSSECDNLLGWPTLGQMHVGWQTKVPFSGCCSFVHSAAARSVDVASESPEMRSNGLRLQVLVPTVPSFVASVAAAAGSAGRQSKLAGWSSRRAGAASQTASSRQSRCICADDAAAVLNGMRVAHRMESLRQRRLTIASFRFLSSGPSTSCERFSPPTTPGASIPFR